MNNIFQKEQKFYYSDSKYQLILGDATKVLKNFNSESIDVIFADPPYFLSNNGITCNSGKMVSVNKANWDRLNENGVTSINDKHKFNRKWIKECYRVLKKDGTIWISGTYHNIYSIGMALEQEGFKIINNITWQKTNPPPNLACRSFTHSTETIIWARKNDSKSKHLFNYSDMKNLNGGKQMKDVWVGGLIKKSEKSKGKHPTQKPLYILERIIKASTVSGFVVLDPFCGSGTTGIPALKNGCNFIGIDYIEEYLNIAKKRLEAL